jgi:hypothetical protein
LRRSKTSLKFIKSFGGSLPDDMHLKDEVPERAPRGGHTDEQIKKPKRGFMIRL